jgi:uncharacterized protein
MPELRGRTPAPARRREALVMLARLPEPGKAKTRLAPALGAEGAAALYRAFTEDLCAVLSPHFPLTLACAPDAAQPYFRRLARRFGLALVAQGEGDLGARMRRLAAQALADVPRVVLIGSDAPTLPVELVRRAFAALGRVRVVLGPSLDGGYYLLGVRPPLPDVFTRMPWGGAQVLARTLRRLRVRGIPHTLLPWWYDVDTAADLATLRRHLALLAALGARPCPRTARACGRLVIGRVP